MRVSGQNGELRYGHQQAAQLGAWTIHPDDEKPGAFLFSSSIIETHPIWIERRPLQLVLSLGHVQWTWHDLEPVTVSDTRVSVLLTRRPDVADVGAYEREEAS